VSESPAGTGAPDVVIPDAYHLVAIQKSSAPDGGAGRDCRSDATGSVSRA